MFADSDVIDASLLLLHTGSERKACRLIVATLAPVEAVGTYEIDAA